MPEALLLSSARTLHAEPAPADQVVFPLNLNADGRLRVASKQGSFPASTADLAAVGSQLAVDVADASNVVLHVKNSGTAAMAAGAFIFEGSVDSTNGTDGTWFGLQAVRTNSNTVEGASGTVALAVGAGMAYGWEMSVNAVKWFRVRTTTAVTASSIARWTALRGSYATEPIPAVQPNTVSGTVTANPAVGTPYSLVSVAGTNAGVVKASAGTLGEIIVFNPTAAVVYVKLYNKATAPVVGTDVPLFTLPLAVNGSIAEEFGLYGKRFSAGIAIAITAGPLATDVAAVAAGVQVSATYV